MEKIGIDEISRKIKTKTDMVNFFREIGKQNL